MLVWTKSSFWPAHSLFNHYNLDVRCMIGLLVCLSFFTSHSLTLTSVQPCASPFNKPTYMQRVDQQWIGTYSEYCTKHNLKAVFHKMFIFNSSDLSVHNGYKCYWRLASDLSGSWSESKTTTEVLWQTLIFLMDAEHELLKQLDLDTISFHSSGVECRLRRIWNSKCCKLL